MECCKKLIWIFIFTVAGGFLIAAPASAAQPSKVRISYSSRNNSITPFQIALNRGFFGEEGIHVELIQVNPRLGPTAVMNGDLEFTTTFGFDNRKETVTQMMQYLDQSPQAAARAYDLLTISLSRNGEISDQDRDNLTEKKKTADEVRDFTLLREAQKELKIR